MGRSGHAGLLHDSEHCKPRCHRELGLSNYLLCHQWPGDGQRQHVNRDRCRQRGVGGEPSWKRKLPRGTSRQQIARHHPRFANDHLG